MYIVINQIIQAISLSIFTRRNVNSFLHSFFRPDFDVEDDLVVVVSESFSDSDKILWSTCEVYNYGLFHIHQRDWQVMKSKESQTKWTLIRMKYLFQTKNLLSTIPPQNSFYKTDMYTSIQTDGMWSSSISANRFPVSPPVDYHLQLLFYLDRSR